MTQEEVFNLITNKIQELEKGYQEDERISLCKNFYKNNFPYQNPLDFMKVDIVEAAYCLYSIESPDNFKKNSAVLNKTLNVFNDMELNGIESFMDLLAILKQKDLLEEIVDYYENLEKGLNTNCKITEIIKEEDIEDLLQILKGFMEEKYHIKLVELFKLLIDDYELLFKYIALIYAKKDMQRYKARIEKNITVMTHIKMNKKDEKKIIIKLLNDEFKMSSLTEELDTIRDFSIDREKEIRKNNKQIGIEVEVLQKAKKILEKSLNEEEITNARKIVTPLKDNEIVTAILELIYSHNKKYYDKLEEEYKTLNKNSKSKYKILLEENNLSLNDNQIDLITRNNIEDLKVILSLLKKLDLSAASLINILINTTKVQTYNVISYLEEGIVPRKYINDNIDLFYENSSKFNLIKEKIDYLSTHNINPRTFNNDINILLIDKNLFINNMQVLSDYNLIKSLKTTINYNFLSNMNLKSQIDKLLELGYEKILEEDLSLLNSQNIKRLEVLKAMNFELTSLEELDKVLNSKFFINDSELDKYIPSVVEYKEKVNLDKETINLNNYKATPRVYDIDGVLVSINKVERNLREGLDLYDAVFTDLNLNEEDYNTVINQLTDKNNKSM